MKTIQRVWLINLLSMVQDGSLSPTIAADDIIKEIISCNLSMSNEVDQFDIPIQGDLD